MVTPRYVVSYSTDVVFKKVRHSVNFCVPLIFNREEDVSFVFECFCELFDFDEITIDEFSKLVTYWTTDGRVTSVESAEWK